MTPQRSIRIHAHSVRLSLLACVVMLTAARVPQSLPGEEVSAPPDASVDLSPSRWPAGELSAFAKLDGAFGGQNQLATSPTGVITGTTSSSAIRAGLEALKQGGSAADAALTTSLTQVTLAQGCWVSYAGIISMVYYDAASNQVYGMNGGYNTVLGEDDSLSIPATASGRTALVPGYMAGIEAAHDRFGKLPFDQLFVPAIYFAAEGFVLHPFHAANLMKRKEVLSRLDETRRVFTNPETGDFYQAGDLFKQPQLAGTLRAVAEQGRDYMYQGDWATRFVAAVQADGGQLSADDMRRYKVQWTVPLRIAYNQHEIYCPGLPAQGGTHLAETLNLMSLAGLARKGHYSESPETFFWQSQFNMVFALSFLPPATQKLVFGRETPLAYRQSEEFAETLWLRMQSGEFSLTQRPQDMGDNHSDAVVAIDREGNIAAVVHTINTSAWGQTGLFVDGVSVPDSASFQQALISRTEPGARLPDPTLPMIVFKDGRPLAAFASIGAGLHAKSVTTLSNLVDFDWDLQAACDAPSMHLPKFSPAGVATQQVFEGDFSEDLIAGVKQLGLRLEVVPNQMSSRAPRGYVVGAAIDADSGTRTAISTQVLNAQAMGQ